MGRNAAIRRFTPARAGALLELFESCRGRRALVTELLATPWLVRASEIACHDGAAVARRVCEGVTVEWDAHRRRPAAFVRGSVRYRVDAVLQVWASERMWWDPRQRVSRRYWRVLARGGVYDLAFDHVHGVWRLIGIQD